MGIIKTLQGIVFGLGMMGCGGCNSLPEECRTYSETNTITLNGEIDGRIDGIAALPSLREGEIISPVWKDFVGEVHLS